MYDVIGDIHGHADALRRLLAAMGYERSNGAWRHPERTAVFVGDLVDRGPEIPETVDIVRSMVEAGSARAAMGNHEYNLLLLETRHPETGAHLRPHEPRTLRQAEATRAQYERTGGYREALAWMATLPFHLELDGARVVHACWHPEHLERLAAARDEHGGFTPAFAARTADRSDPLWRAIEVVLKGPECRLPEGAHYADREGHVRRRMRVRWFDAPDGHTWGSYAFPARSELPADPVAPEAGRHAAPYDRSAPPCFFGHYWMAPDERAAPVAPNLACLDYSVARSGPLVAYRWEGEPVLRADGFVSVGPSG